MRATAHDSKESPFLSIRGATAVEFALVALAFFILLIGFLDAARLLALKGLLTKGAQNGLNLAQKIQGTELDLRGLPALDPSRAKYHSALNKVVGGASDVGKAAELLLNSGFITDTGAPSAAVLDSYVITPLDGVPTSARHALLLRPGESATVVETGETIEHPTFPSTALATTTKPYKTILAEQPLYVETRAQIRMFLPFLGTLTVRGRALGFREGATLGIPPFPLTTTTTTTTTTTSTTTTTRTTTTTIFVTTTTTTILPTTSTTVRTTTTTTLLATTSTTVRTTTTTISTTTVTTTSTSTIPTTTTSTIPTTTTTAITTTTTTLPPTTTTTTTSTTTTTLPPTCCKPDGFTPSPGYSCPTNYVVDCDGTRAPGGGSGSCCIFDDAG